MAKTRLTFVRGLILSACLVPKLASAQLASAESERETIAATFETPSGCGDRQILIDRFETRVPQRRLSFQAKAPVEFTLQRTSRSVTARLLILLEDGGELSRTIEADDCDSAIEAIAFIAAVALDPGAEDPLQVRQKPDLPEPQGDSEPNESEPPKRERPRRFWQLGAFGRANQGQAPDFVWGGGLSIENGSRQSGLWAPSIRMLAGHSRRGGFEQEAGRARFELSSMALDLCPSQGLGEIFRVQLCATMEAGVLRARGLDTFEPNVSARPWIALGPSASTEVTLAGPIGLSYRAAAVFPMIRDEFQFDESVFHEVPAVALELDAGLFIRFW